MDSPILLPAEIATPVERALEQALRPDKQPIEDAISRIRGIKYFNTPPSLLPWLILEYGLGELTAYVDNDYLLVAQGPRWQRLRGTPAAMDMGLAWIGHAAREEFARWDRRHWNWWQSELAAIPPESDLIRIEGISNLSAPLRSHYWRGFRGYDVRALEWGGRRWGGALWSNYSGIPIAPGAAKWSFGRRYDLDHTMTEPDLRRLGVWLPPTGAAARTWGPTPWPPTPWADSSANARSIAMLNAITQKLHY